MHSSIYYVNFIKYDFQVGVFSGRVFPEGVSGAFLKPVSPVWVCWISQFVMEGKCACLENDGN